MGRRRVRWCDKCRPGGIYTQTNKTTTDDNDDKYKHNSDPKKKNGEKRETDMDIRL